MTAEKPLPYRLIIHNIPPSRDEVKSKLEEELGAVELVRWKIEQEFNHQKMDERARIMLPHREYVIKLTYKQV